MLLILPVFRCMYVYMLYVYMEKGVQRWPKNGVFWVFWAFFFFWGVVRSEIEINLNLFKTVFRGSLFLAIAPFRPSPAQLISS